MFEVALSKYIKFFTQKRRNYSQSNDYIFGFFEGKMSITRISFFELSAS